MKKKIFIVCMDSSYIRDAQYFCVDELSDEEMDFEYSEPFSSCWTDMYPNAYIDTVLAENEKEACKIAGENNRYDPRVLYAFEAKPTNI